MAKKEESLPNVLGLLPPTPPSNGNGVTYGLAVNTGNSLSETQQHIAQEAHKQELVIDLQTAKTLYAAEMVSEIRQSGSDSFHKLMEHHTTINAAVHGKASQPYVEEFNHRNAQTAAQNEFELMQAGVGRIIDEVKRPLYQKDVEPKRSALQRLLGG